MILLNMFPVFSIHNVADARAVNVKLFGYFFLRVFATCIHLANLAYLVRVQLGLAVFDPLRAATKHPQFVPEVFTNSHVLKIRSVIVSFISVFVVHLLALWAWAKKRFSYKPVDGCKFSFPINIKAYGKIPVPIKFCLAHLPFMKVPVSTYPVKATQPSMIANLINTLIPGNVTPLFHNTPQNKTPSTRGPDVRPTERCRRRQGLNYNDVNCLGKHSVGRKAIISQVALMG